MVSFPFLYFAVQPDSPDLVLRLIYDNFFLGRRLNEIGCFVLDMKAESSPPAAIGLTTTIWEGLLQKAFTFINVVLTRHRLILR